MNNLKYKNSNVQVNLSYYFSDWKGSDYISSGSGYGGYSAPAQSYGGYGAQSQSYGGYSAPAQSYGAQTQSYGGSSYGSTTAVPAYVVFLSPPPGNNLSFYDLLI